MYIANLNLIILKPKHMKKITLLLSLVLSINLAMAQDAVGTAFKDSYVHEYAGDYAKAIAAFDKVYSADSYAINLRLGWLCFENGEHTKSQNYYSNAMKLQPKSIEARLGYAAPASALGNWDKIIELYKEILAIDANNYTVNSRLAFIYMDRKDFDTAIKYAAVVANQHPFDYSANLLLGKINIGLGKIADAKKHLNKALLYDPTSSEVLDLLKKV